MKVLVACEFSGIVRDAFKNRGHDAWSCDLLETESPGNHLMGDVREYLDLGWDIMIAHPPCTHLAACGARWFNNKRKEQNEAIDFVKILMDAPIPRIAIENPVGIISSRIRKPDQTFQPWLFGHGEVKRICLWLKNLPKLRPGYDRQWKHSDGRYPRSYLTPSGPDQWKKRSRFFEGVAAAMADQWGILG